MWQWGEMAFFAGIHHENKLIVLHFCLKSCEILFLPLNIAEQKFGSYILKIETKHNSNQ